MRKMIINFQAEDNTCKGCSFLEVRTLMLSRVYFRCSLFHPREFLKEEKGVGPKRCKECLESEVEV